MSLRLSLAPFLEGEDSGTDASLSREVPCSALKGETVPDSLPATPKSPPTRRVPPRLPGEPQDEASLTREVET